MNFQPLSSRPRLLFVSQLDDPDAWRGELARAAPELDVCVWPDAERLQDVELALVWKPPSGLLAALPRLKAVFSLGAGADDLLTDPALSVVPIVRMIEPALTQGMVEYVVLQVLASHRRSLDYAAQERARIFRPLPQKLAKERRVGVLGLGALGAPAAAALAELRFNVTGWSRTEKSIPKVRCLFGAAALDQFLKDLEILVCLLPSTDETRGILNRRTFALLSEGAYVINAARGVHLVADDLLHALREGRLAGAILDVFSEEPLPAEHPFFAHPRIVVTPHVASNIDVRTAAAAVAENIRRLRAGLPMHGTIDRARGY